LKPARLPSVRPEQTFFITASTFQKRFLLQGKVLAEMFVSTMLAYRDQSKFSVHAFVVMPNHIHLLITPAPDSTLERSVQLIRGGFS
jgi:putative transposase